MPISNLLQHRVTVYRMGKGAGIAIGYQKHLINVPCFIQPMSAEFAAKVGMAFGKSYYCYANVNVDIKQGDHVVDQDGKTYGVSGSMKRNYGRNQNMTFYLSEQAGTGGLN